MSEQPPNGPSSGQPPWDRPSGPPPWEQQPAQPRPWEQPWPSDGRQYPRQNLLPQEVKPGRSRKPLFIGLGVVLALIVAGGAAYAVLRDTGENNRAAYCAALRSLTHNGDLIGAVNAADATTIDAVQRVMDLAPKAVADDWQKLETGIKAAQASGSPDMAHAISMFTALRNIGQDSKQNCDLDLQIPLQ